jgi:predicted transcriptional regulator
MFDVPSPSEARRLGGRRSPVDLYATILEVVKRYGDEGRITRISYGAGMPVNRLRQFVDRLVALDLLHATDHDGWSTYSITHRGQEFLDTYWKMRGFTGLLEARMRPNPASAETAGTAPDAKVGPPATRKGKAG